MKRTNVVTILTIAIGLLFAASPSQAERRPTVSDPSDCFGSRQGECEGALCWCCYDDGCWICDNDDDPWNSAGQCAWDNTYRPHAQQFYTRPGGVLAPADTWSTMPQLYTTPGWNAPAQ